jgi:SAM-dependent methyltransferase
MIVISSILAGLLVIIALLLAYSFAIGIVFGAPYLPTMRGQRQTALELLDLKPGQTLYDLGCGDGRMLKAAAERGLNAVGYELSPLLVLMALVINWRYRRQVSVRWGNFWRADLSGADGIYVFLLTKYMVRFDKLVRARVKKGTKVASYTFKIPRKKPIAQANAVYLYKY